MIIDQNKELSEGALTCVRATIKPFLSQAV